MNRKIFDELEAVYNLPETQEKANAVIDKLNSIKIARSELESKLDRERHSATTEEVAIPTPFILKKHYSKEEFYKLTEAQREEYLSSLDARISDITNKVMSEKNSLLEFIAIKDVSLEYNRRDSERKIIEDKLKPILGAIVFKNESLRDELMKQVLGGKNRDNKKRLKKCYREYKNIGTAKDKDSPVPYVRYISDRRLKKLSPDEQLQYRRRRAEYLASSDIRKGKLSIEIEAILGNEAIDSCMICALEKEITNTRDKRVLASYYRLLNEQRSNIPYTRLGILLRDLRISRKQSLEDMAALLCIRPSYLIALGRGERSLTKYQYDCLIDYYKPNREDMKILQEAIGTKRVAV